MQISHFPYRTLLKGFWKGIHQNYPVFYISFIFKVETIGDAYMVASGLPIRHGDKHAGEIASMALHLLSKIKKFKIKHMEGEVLQLRIGIHSGE